MISTRQAASSLYTMRGYAELKVLMRLLLVCFIATRQPPVVAQSRGRSESGSCPDIPKYNDVASRTLRSVIVFSGSFVSSQVSKQPGSVSDVGVKKPPISRSQSLFTAVFKVERLLKGQWTKTRDDDKNLEILIGTRIDTPSSGAQSKVDCAGLLGLKAGIKYLAFLDGLTSAEDTTGVIMYHPEGRPVKLTKRDEKIVEKLSCPTCKGRPPKVKLTPPVKLIHRMTRTTFLLTCEFSGNPPPVVEWYKDSVRLIPSDNVEINSLKTASQLNIRNTALSDTGTYWCKASNVLNTSLSQKITVNITEEPHVSDEDNGDPCNADMSRYYCLNEGTCRMTRPPHAVEYCICTDYFSGKRCLERVGGPDVNKASLLDPFVIVGLLVGAVIIIILIFIAYFLAKRQWKPIGGATGAGENQSRLLVADRFTQTTMANGSIKHSHRYIDTDPITNREESISPAHPPSSMLPYMALTMDSDSPSPPRHFATPLSRDNPAPLRASPALSHPQKRIVPVTYPDDTIFLKSRGPTVTAPKVTWNPDTVVVRQISTDSCRALINGEDQCDSTKQSTIRSQNLNSTNQNSAYKLKPQGSSENTTSASEDDVDSKTLICVTNDSSRLQATPSPKGARGALSRTDNNSKSPERTVISPRYVAVPDDGADKRKKDADEIVNSLLRELNIDPAMYVSQNEPDVGIRRQLGVDGNLNFNGSSGGGWRTRRDASISPSGRRAESPTEMSSFLSSSSYV